MKIISHSALLAAICVSPWGFASVASAETTTEAMALKVSSVAPAMVSFDDDDDDDSPNRPGGNNYFSRNNLNDDDDDDDDDENYTPARPGGNNHYPRNGMSHDNDDHPVTGNRKNKGTDALGDALDTAGGIHH